METSYGALKDKWDGIRSLATLAFAKYRDPYFRNELLVALKIIQDGHIAREKFVSSWAGAMGQTQFMPTNFVDYGIDFDGDGKRDIWNSVPDVLASTANYFQKVGWKWGVPWGFEVIIPKGFDLMKSHASFEEWDKLGVRRADGAAYPASGDGILFFPAGVPGPAFVVTSNFDVIKDYNRFRRLRARHRSSRRSDAGRRAVPDAVAGTRHPASARRPDRAATKARRAWLRSNAVLGPHRFQDARLRARRAEQAQPVTGWPPDGRPA